MSHTNSSNIILRILIFLLIINAENSFGKKTEIPDSVYIDSLISKELEELNLFYRRNYTFVQTNQPTSANKKGQIEVSFEELVFKAVKYKISIESPDFTFLIRLTLAHEYSHLLQHEWNKTIPDTKIKIIEAQADILAARYYALKAYEEALEDENLSKNITTLNLYSQKYHDVYVFFYDLGTRSFSKAHHPDHYERGTAAFRGTAYAQLEILLKRIKYFKSQTTSDEQFVENLKADAKLMIESLRFSKDISRWSYEQAKLIVHGDSKNFANVIRTKHTTELSRDGKTIESKITFKNIGKTYIIFSFESRIGIYREDSISVFTNLFGFDEMYYHSFGLMPNRKRTIKDSFRFKSESNQEIIVPPLEGSLFHVESFHTKKKDFKDLIFDYKRELKNEHNSLRQSSFEDIFFSSYLLILLDAISSKDYSNIVDNIGVYIQDKQIKGSIVEYTGTVPHLSGFNCKITRWRKNEKYSSIELYFEPVVNFTTADSIYTRYKSFFDHFNLFELELNENVIRNKSGGNMNSISSFDRKLNIMRNTSYKSQDSFIGISITKTEINDYIKYDKFKKVNFQTAQYYRNPDGSYQSVFLSDTIPSYSVVITITGRPKERL